MKCVHCSYEGPMESFRYLYNVRLDEPTGNRECPQCFGWVMVDHKIEETAADELQGKVPGADLSK